MSKTRPNWAVLGNTCACGCGTAVTGKWKRGHNKKRDLDNYEIVTETGCWIWMGGVGSSGYGVCQNNKGAHRVFYETYVGPIPQGMMVCHRCDTRACVNPEHLFLGDHSINALDMVRKGRSPLKKLVGKREEIIAHRAAGLSTKNIAAIYGVALCSIDAKLKRGTP